MFGFGPQVPSQRVQMIFEVKGLDHKGIVSLEAFKRRGEYHFVSAMSRP